MASFSNELPRFPSAQSLSFGTRPALLVIDVCNAYLTPGSPLYAPQRFDVALAAIERVIELFRSLRLPIIFTRVSLASPAMGGKWFTEKLPHIAPCFSEGSDLGKYPSGSRICRFREGQSRSEFEIVKQYASAFFGTSLASLLSSMGVDTTVIVGFSTSGCVRATSLDAIQHGFRPFVVEEACGDRDSDVHRSNMFDIQAKIGEVVPLRHLEGGMKDLDIFSVDSGTFQRPERKESLYFLPAPSITSALSIPESPAEIESPGSSKATIKSTGTNHFFTPNSYWDEVETSAKRMQGRKVVTGQQRGL